MEKKINFELIPDGHEAYEVLSEMRKHHPEVSDADIALAWHKALKADKDGHLVLGKCVKVSDLHREFLPHDFIIVLNKQVWEDKEFTRDKKNALVDHELTHCSVATDDDGDKVDDRGRKVWRIRKHDIEEFNCIVERHGCYKKDLEHFAELILRKQHAPLFHSEPSKQTTADILQ